jgi:excisionase family DNA binding protein
MTVVHAQNVSTVIAGIVLPFSQNSSIFLMMLNIPKCFKRHGLFCMNDAEIFTLKELAFYLKLAEKTAYRLASEGKLPGFKIGGSWRFRKSELERWIHEQELKTE